MPTEAIPDQLPEETAAGEPQPAAEESAGETPAEGSFDALVALLQDRITQNGQTSPTVADASPANSARSLSCLLYTSLAHTMGGVHHQVGEAAVVGEQQQALAVLIQTAHREYPHRVIGQ